jgi:hypothetical protein
VQVWHAARLRARATKRRKLPALTSYIDPLADLLVLITRMGLGALAGALFHAQVIGATAAIAVGASAPALLRQVGAARDLADLGIHEGTAAKAGASKTMAELDSPLAEDA